MFFFCLTKLQRKLVIELRVLYKNLFCDIVVLVFDDVDCYLVFDSYVLSSQYLQKLFWKHRFDPFFTRYFNSSFKFPILFSPSLNWQIRKLSCWLCPTTFWHTRVKETMMSCMCLMSRKNTFLKKLWCYYIFLTSVILYFVIWEFEFFTVYPLCIL